MNIALTIEWASRFRSAAADMPDEPPLDVDPILWKAQREALIHQADRLEAEARGDVDMSWSFDFVAESKAAAKQALAERGQHVPQSLQEVICASIDEQLDGYAILVKTNGHIGGQWAHNATFEVRGIQLERAAPDAPAQDATSG